MGRKTRARKAMFIIKDYKTKVISENNKKIKNKLQKQQQQQQQK